MIDRLERKRFRIFTGKALLKRHSLELRQNVAAGRKFHQDIVPEIPHLALGQFADVGIFAVILTEQFQRVFDVKSSLHTPLMGSVKILLRKVTDGIDMLGGDDFLRSGIAPAQNRLVIVLGEFTAEAFSLQPLTLNPCQVEHGIQHCPSQHVQLRFLRVKVFEQLLRHAAPPPRLSIIIQDGLFGFGAQFEHGLSRVRASTFTDRAESGKMPFLPFELIFDEIGYSLLNFFFRNHARYSGINQAS